MDRFGPQHRGDDLKTELKCLLVSHTVPLVCHKACQILTTLMSSVQVTAKRETGLEFTDLTSNLSSKM